MIPKLWDSSGISALFLYGNLESMESAGNTPVISPDLTVALKRILNA